MQLIDDKATWSPLLIKKDQFYWKIDGNVDRRSSNKRLAYDETVDTRLSEVK